MIPKKRRKYKVNEHMSGLERDIVYMFERNKLLLGSISREPIDSILAALNICQIKTRGV